MTALSNHCYLEKHNTHINNSNGKPLSELPQSSLTPIEVRLRCQLLTVWDLLLETGMK